MEQHPVTRRLSAILAADVAGYSRLTASDEEGTLGRLKALRQELIDPAIARYRGRIVKTTGDGILIEFPSVVDAVRNAAEVQRGMAARNALVEPERRIDFRVGIHLGDVVVDGDDLLGDGVNIAARLEGIADPGGICLSRAAWEQVEGKLALSVEDLGEQSLKNIARPVRVYKVAMSGAPASAGAPTARAAPRLSIVVLPFANLSGNPAEDYFADGITEDITTDLSRIPESFVIARNTAFTYKGKPVDAKQVGRELSVRYVLEGSVRRGGNRVRANVQLIDAETGAHLWAERFDCDRADLMELQDEVTGRMASALGTQLIDAESRRSLKERAADPDAVDLAMCGWSVLHHPPSRETLAEARTLFEQALAKDPRAVDAMIGLAYCYIRAAQSGFTDQREKDIDRAAGLVEQALLLEPDRARAHWVRGMVLKNNMKIEQAVAAFETAISLDRNFAPAFGSLGDVVTFLGKPEETIRLNLQAMRLSPRDPQLANWQFDAGQACLMLGRDAEALEWLLRARTINPHFPWVPLALAMTYALLGDIDSAHAALADFHKVVPQMTSIAAFRAVVPLFDLPQMQPFVDRIFEGLRLAGMPDN